MKPLTIAALVCAGAVLLQKGSRAMMPRGIRNNNPGNIKKNGIPWKGLVRDERQTDPTFFIFAAPHWGIRAIGKDLTTDYTRDGQQTIRALISEYAPGNENNTSAYIKHVSELTGLHPDAVLDLDRDLAPLVAAIIRHENGQQPYSRDYIEQSLAIV